MRASWTKNSWKAAVIGGVVAIVALVSGRAVIGALTDDRDPERVAARSTAKPSSRAVDDCNRYAAQVARNNGRIVKEGLIGGAVGAGIGAAGGAVADGGSGAGKGAGIGAIVGAAAGAIHGLSEENRKSEQAAVAYRTCMAQRSNN